MDDIDQAQANDEIFRQSALRAHFAASRSTLSRSPKPGPHSIEAGPGGGQHLCLDCGDEIEPARLKALPHAVRCIDCQGKKERRDKHGLV